MSHSIVSKIFLSKLGSAKLKESLIFTMSYLQLTVLVEIKLQEMDWIRHGNFVKLTTSPMMVLLCATGTALNLLGNGQPGKLAFTQCSGLLRNLSNFFTTSLGCRHTTPSVNGFRWQKNLPLLIYPSRHPRDL